MANSILHWIENWFNEQCDGEWEHEYGIKINTVDNPGWYITIDLTFTKLEFLELEVEVGTIENNENDWHFYMIKNKQYKASGDIKKLEFLLLKFKEIAESHT